MSPHALAADDIAEIACTMSWSPLQRDALQTGLTALAVELAVDSTMPEAMRRQHRRERLDTLRSVSAALIHLTRAVEHAKSAGAKALRDMLAGVLARLMSTGAFGLLLDHPIDTTVSFHLLESRAGQMRGGPYGALEQEMTSRRQAMAQDNGDALLAAFAQCLARSLEAELKFERLNTGGRPIDRPRRLALIRLVLLYEQITGLAVTAAHDRSFLDFSSSCFEVLKLPDEGLENALFRLIKQTSKSTTS